MKGNGFCSELNEESPKFGQISPVFCPCPNGQYLGLNYKYPADNTRQGLNAHMQFIANDATLQIGIGDTRGLPASLIVTHSPAMFACDACGKVYRYYRNLQSHIRQECGKEPRILCPFCPYRTKIKSNLKKHIQIKHPVTATQIIL